MSPKKVLIILLKFAISFAILYWLYCKAEQNNQIEKFINAEKRWPWLFAALATIFATFLVSFTRWFLLVRAVGLPLRWYESVRLGFIGQSLGPITFGVLGGDTIKAILVYRRVKSRAAEAFASIAADRALGLLAMVATASVAFLVFDFSEVIENHPQHWNYIQTVCYAAIGMTVVGMTGLFILFLVPGLQKSRAVFALKRWALLSRIVDKVLSIAKVYRQRWAVLLVAFGMSLLINLLFATTIYFAALGVTREHPTYPQHFVISPISMVANSVPLPAGIGGMEFALTNLYDAMTPVKTSADQQGFVVSVVFRILLLTIAMTGLPIYFFSRSELKKLKYDDAAETPDDPQK